MVAGGEISHRNENKNRNKHEDMNKNNNKITQLLPLLGCQGTYQGGAGMEL